MEKADEVKRDYSIADHLMLLQGQGILDIFIENKLKFTEKYFNVKDPFAANMQIHLDFCNSFSRDKSIRSNQVGETNKVKIELNNGRLIYQYIYGYLLMVEPTDGTVRKNFGQPEYEESRRSATKLPVLLEQAYEYVNEPILKQKLMDKGAKEVDILSLHLTAKAISEALQIQKSYKGGRKTSKKDRIIGLNKVWADMSLLSVCSKVVFMNDYAMYHTFLLYPKVVKETKASRKGENKNENNKPE